MKNYFSKLKIFAQLLKLFKHIIMKILKIILTFILKALKGLKECFIYT